MSIYIYDEALIQKLRYWTQKTQINVYNVDESNRLLQVIANKTNDENIKLPIIALRRADGFTISNPNKKPMTYSGTNLVNELQLKYNEMKAKVQKNEISLEDLNKWTEEHKDLIDNTEVASLEGIPIKINYKLDVYTRYQKENDIYMRNLIFNIINYPTFAVHFTYEDIPIEHNANIYLSDTVSATSSEIRLFQDQICKQTLDIYIPDAYLWNIKKTAPKTLNIVEGGIPGENASEYDPNITYNIGDYCKYNGEIYECIKKYIGGTSDKFLHEYWKKISDVSSLDNSYLQIWNETEFITENI